jgi:hypothetical protein
MFRPIRKVMGWLWTIAAILASSIAILGIAVWFAKWLQYFYCGSLWDWAQTAGAVLAIVAGFAAALMQLNRQKADSRAIEVASGHAALQLAHDALDAVTDRLDAALTPVGESHEFALRGGRTGELVGAMREFDTGRLPSPILADFIRLRSLVAAVNQRLTEVYGNEVRPGRSGKGRTRAERNDRLESAVNTRNDAVTIYESLHSTAKRHYGTSNLRLTRYSRVENYRTTGVKT